MARILIVEDNPGNLELMTYLLAAFGHDVLAAGDGEAGIDMARRERPDLVLCDIQLPGVDGYEVVRVLKADAGTRSIPVVAVSAMAMVGDQEKGLAAGFDGYIAKPIDPQHFMTEVDSYLDSALHGRRPADHVAAQTAADHIRVPPCKARVVVVDDSLTNCELIYQTLVPSGYEVLAVDNVPAALQLARREAPQLILSDLHMPGEDGFDFVRQVKADPQLAGIPFIFISSSVWGEQDRDKALALGVTLFLLRPIEPQVLLQEIAACLERFGGG